MGVLRRAWEFVFQDGSGMSLWKSHKTVWTCYGQTFLKLKTTYNDAEWSLFKLHFTKPLSVLDEKGWKNPNDHAKPILKKWMK